MMIYLGASTDHEDVDDVTTMAHANSNTPIGVLLESETAIENLGEILVEGVDLARISTQDLAQNPGVPGQMDHPRIQAAKEEALLLCQERGIALFGAVSRLEDIPAAADKGARCVPYGSDVIMLRREAQRAVEVLRTWSSVEQQ